MTREAKGLPPNGPVKVIDWDVVDDLLIKGCTGTQIASRLGIHPDTLYHRCEDEKGSLFSAYAQKKREKGDSLLLETQFNMAIKEDRGMLIWLGKQRLGQQENPGVASVPAEFAQLFQDTMKAIFGKQKRNANEEIDQIDLKSEESSINSDT
jgi:hypothetical protein